MRTKNLIVSVAASELCAGLLFLGTAQAEAQILRKGSRGSEVTKLQETLAAMPDLYPEKLVTGYFGVLTKQAVQRFQAKYNIVSSGDENTTGYGQVGPKTRAKLNELATTIPSSTTTRKPNPEKCPDGIWDEAEQKDINLCPEDNPINNPTTSSPSVSTTTPLQSPSQPSVTAPLSSATPQTTTQTQDPYGTQSPYWHSVMSAISTDGLNWMIDEKFKTIEHVSVPAAILRPDGTVILYFVDFRDALDSKSWDTTDCMISSNGVDFQNADCLIRNLASPKAWDPAPLYINGEYRLYYFASGLPIQNHEIHVATSSDGVHFTEAGSVFSYTDLVDPDVIFFKDRYLMYVFSVGTTIIAESKDGKNFQKNETAFIKDCGSTKPIEYEHGKLRVYCFWQKGQDAGKVVSAVSTDGFNFALESGTRLAISGKLIADPYVIRMPDNTWRMYFKVQTIEQTQSTTQSSSGTIISTKCYKYINGQKTEVPCSTLIQIK